MSPRNLLPYILVSLVQEGTRHPIKVYLATAFLHSSQKITSVCVVCVVCVRVWCEHVYVVYARVCVCVCVCVHMCCTYVCIWRPRKDMGVLLYRFLPSFLEIISSAAELGAGWQPASCRTPPIWPLHAGITDAKDHIWLFMQGLGIQTSEASFPPTHWAISPVYKRLFNFQRI